MRSDAAKVEDYIAGLPDGRQEAIATLRKLILKHLPKGYVEEMRYGMISYEVPLSVEPKTYNGLPLNYAGLASQKNHMAVYLCGLHYMTGLEDKFRKAWKGGKLDMGKSCIRFQRIETLDMDLIGKTIASVPMAEFIKVMKR